MDVLSRNENVITPWLVPKRRQYAQGKKQTQLPSVPFIAVIQQKYFCSYTKFEKIRLLAIFSLNHAHAIIHV